MVDLHVHSNASDGECSPDEVIHCAKAAGVRTVALTDHDTVGGVAPARESGERLGVRVIGGCEFSVQVTWGELHLLGYFLPPDDPDLQHFLEDQRTKRVLRAHAIVERLARAGATIGVEDVMGEAAGGSVGRPHVARVLVKAGLVRDITGAFRKYLAARKPAFVPKELPSLEQVTTLVRDLSGVTSAAHLGPRGNRPTIEELKRAGVDAIEVLHPSHNDTTAARLDALAVRFGMLATGGSDWHGDGITDHDRAPIGSLDVPEAWLAGIESLHQKRLHAQ